ncbi:MAG: response regulator [Bacteroidetes bacterium]|nr:response regulator [Bacteroidota bacterium]
MISVESEKGVGTTFFIELPFGKEHFNLDRVTIIDRREHHMEMQKLFADQAEKIIPSDNKLNETHDQSILVIEDDYDLRRFVTNSLNSNYEVIEAENGEAGLNIAIEHLPDLIICDVMLPKMDGFEVTSILKEDFRTLHIPVIILTAMDRAENEIRSLKRGADAYVTKPFNLSLLKERIRMLLKTRDSLKDHYLYELPIDNAHQSVGRLDRKFISELTAQVGRNISNSEFGVKDICENLKISRVQVYRKVKALIGCSVRDYIISVRLKRAKQLLAESKNTVAEIAYEVGFSTPAYFSTAFKNKYGVTPS